MDLVLAALAGGCVGLCLAFIVLLTQHTDGDR